MIASCHVDTLVDAALKAGRRFVYCRFNVVEGRLRSRIINPWNPAGWLA